MSDAPPPSLLVTPDARRRLQQWYEEAMRLAGQEPCDHARVHDLLAECLRADPGSILYLDALLANLRRWKPKARRSWLAGWLGGKTSPAHGRSLPDELLQAAPELLRDGYRDVALLGELAAAAGKCQLDEAELIYWWQAAYVAPNDDASLRGLARCLARCGRFEEALANWRKLAAAGHDEEATQALADLESIADTPLPTSAEGNAIDPTDAAAAIAAAARLVQQGAHGRADELLRRSLSAAGGELRLLEAVEAVQLVRSIRRIGLAQRRAAHDEHPKAQSLVDRLEQEHNRLEIDIFHLRCERHPDALSLRLELARRLKRAGNYSGAIQRLEEARADRRLAAEAFLELGECWQHLRQYEKALDFYRQAVDATEREGEAPAEPQRSIAASPRPLVGALFRIGVLAAAMNRPDEAKAALARLIAIEPTYKDARQRLDNLP